MRIEDLDRARVRPGAAAAQLADLTALGIDWDGPVVRQSERLERYAEAIAALDAAGELYPCYCTRAEIRLAASWDGARQPSTISSCAATTALPHTISPWSSRTASRACARSCSATAP